MDAPPSTKATGALGAALAFLVPLLTLSFAWVVLAFFTMLAANGVMKNVDALTSAYVGGTVLVALGCTAASGAGALALARRGRLPLWAAVLLTTSLSVLVLSVGACVIFIGAGTALDIF